MATWSSNRLFIGSKGGTPVGHVCPWWLGYVLASPLRRIFQPQERILGDYVKAGMTVLDVGSGMGYFSLWMARTVTESGRVVCVDLQEKMLRSLKRRAVKAGLEARIEVRVCGKDNLGINDLAGQIDFALLFAVAHEVPDPLGMLSQVQKALNADGACLLAEPRGHVTEAEFEDTVRLTGEAGFYIIDRPAVPRSRAALFGKH
ncbi:MAG: class I SAM-dependent methyltransferase [Candidatus Zixiibacteriota bacterium]|nr:MAG: class I SAM-dependent methyltransferase [candidate division Zixibacteria bacterium]